MRLIKTRAGKATAFFHSVRFRLALWFALVLAIVLFVFSALVYARTAQDLRNQTAARLVIRLRDMNDRLKYMGISSIGSGWWSPDTSHANPFTLQEQEVVIVCDPEARLAETWGSLSVEDTTGITRLVIDPAYSFDPNHYSDRLFTYSLIRKNKSDNIATNYLFAPAPILFENHLWGWIILGQPIDPEGQLPRLFWTLVLAGLLTLLVAPGGAYWLADRALRPVKVITRTAREISESDLNRRLNIAARDELGELADTFDRMLDRLQAAFDRQRQFTADASHELRTPLTIIGLETGRVLEGKRSAEDYRSALEVIHSENAFMTRLVSELLTLARMDAGQIKLDREPLDLSDVVLEVVERFENLAANKGVRLAIGSLPELPILGDRQYLAQMIGNLVDNAIKYSQPNKTSSWVRVDTGNSPDENPTTVWLRVSDNGLGIASEHLPHLFERFYRVDRARSHNLEENLQLDEDEIPGSGLGLSIVQWIAQMHDGRVTVQSQPGQGSTFEIILPGLVDQSLS